MNAMTDQEQLDTAKSFFQKYGSAMISGVLIALIAFFGWQYWNKKTSAEDQISTAKVLKLASREPLFGHRRGTTVFLVFMKSTTPN